MLIIYGIHSGCVIITDYEKQKQFNLFNRTIFEMAAAAVYSFGVHESDSDCHRSESGCSDGNLHERVRSSFRLPVHLQ